MDNHNTSATSGTPQRSEPLTINDLVPIISAFKRDNDQKELELERMRIEAAKDRLEAEQKADEKNKIYGGTLVILALTAYTVLLWNGKASEGFGVLITTVVTSGLAGIFKGLIGKKRKDADADTEE